MTTKNTIETTADGSIVLPTYSHATDGWKFTDNEYGVLIFQSENKMLGMEFNIFIGWDDPQPHAELNPSESKTITEAENLFDMVDSVSEFHAWLKDCAAAFDWIQTVDAEKGIDVLVLRKLRRRDRVGRCRNGVQPCNSTAGNGGRFRPVPQGRRVRND